jgi:hypothetical protein
MHLPRVRFTLRWMMAAVGLVALILTPIAAWLESRQFRSGEALGAEGFAGRPSGARLSTREAIKIAESAFRKRGGDPGLCQIGWVRFDNGRIWSILFDDSPPTPGGCIIQIDDMTNEAILLPGE